MFHCLFVGCKNPRKLKTKGRQLNRWLSPKLHTGRREAETGVMLPQAENIWSHQKLEEARKHPGA